MTRAEASKLVACLLAAFPSSRASDGTSAVYERMLADLDYARANAAVERLIATSRFMPTIAEIRETCVEQESGGRRPGGEAWGDVLRAVSQYGFYRSPGFDDPLVARAVDAFGWREICLSENQQADRARFIQLYDQLAARDQRELQAGPYALPERAAGTMSIGAAVAGLLGAAARKVSK